MAEKSEKKIVNKTKNLTCVCCGGTINRTTKRCDYCGTEYIIDDDIPIIRMETYTNPVKEYKACSLIQNEAIEVGGADYVSYVIRQLAKEMMPAIIDGMVFRVDDDHMSNTKKISASLKVVIPKAKGDSNG